MDEDLMKKLALEELDAYLENYKGGLCECGAKHTSNHHYHSDWCPANEDTWDENESVF